MVNGDQFGWGVRMGRPNQCNCWCELDVPCDDELDKCWTPLTCDSDEYFADFTNEFMDKHEFIVVVQAEYAYAHEVIMRRGDSGDNILAEIPINEEGSGSRLVVLSTDLDIVGESLRYLRHCFTMNISGERLSIDKSKIRRGFFVNKTYLPNNAVQFKAPFAAFVYSVVKSKIITSLEDGLLTDKPCISKCFTEEEVLADSEFLERFYGIRSPEPNVRYCGFNQDGEIYTEKKLETSQLSVNGSIGDFRYYTDFFREFNHFSSWAHCENKIFLISAEHKIEFGGQGFSGTYPAVPVLWPPAGWGVSIDPYPLGCYSQLHSYPVPPIYITGSIKYKSIFYNNIGCACPISVEFEVPYAGYAWLKGAGFTSTWEGDTEIFDAGASVEGYLYKNVSYDPSPYPLPNSNAFPSECWSEEQYIKHQINLAPYAMSISMGGRNDIEDDTCVIGIGSTFSPNIFGGTNNRVNFGAHSYGSFVNENYVVPVNDDDLIPSVGNFGVPITLGTLKSPFFLYNDRLSSYYGCCFDPRPFDLSGTGMFLRSNCSGPGDGFGLGDFGGVKTASLGMSRIDISTTHTTSGGRG